MSEEERRLTYDDVIKELRHKVPFMPFNIVMASGDRYLIDDPDMMIVTSLEIIYVVPRTEQTVRLRKSQISAIEELQPRQVA